MSSSEPVSTRPPGRVFVISGPTAVGKGTVVAELVRQHPEIYVSISATTRPARANEVDGKHYYFVTDAQFDDLVANHQLLEWAQVHNLARYGTPREPVCDAMRAGRTVILEIDLQGARQVRKTMPEAVQIFLAPPNWDCLLQRLSGRGTETIEQQQQRLATAKIELAAQSEFDEIVVNDRVEETVAALVELLGL